MSLPSNNSSFQKGNFSGFKTKGLARVVSTFDASIHGRSSLVAAPHGSFFACLDGAGLAGSTARIDSNGVRRAGNKPKPASFSNLKVKHDNKLTYGGLGASLSCSDVTLSPGELLIFLWKSVLTVVEHRVSNNAFALLQLIDGASNEIVQSHTLITARSLTNGLPQRFGTDWTETQIPWAGSHAFHGTVRWLVCSGHAVDDLDDPDPRAAAIAAAWPACLMIDHIRLS